jgi:hypothetical protein
MLAGDKGAHKMEFGSEREGWGRYGESVFAVFLCSLFLFSLCAYGQLYPEDVLILVNENSPTSKYAAKLYRQYHPEIGESQVLYLTGLDDCSGPDSNGANEIITREQYNQCIAEPVRNYLADSNHPDRITRIKVIITTAGLPYRIEDTVYDNAIYPTGSNPDTIISQESSIDAASVESELTCLWYSDYDSNGFGLTNRMVNPYQGYRSSVELFPRDAPGTKEMTWALGISLLAPLVEHPLMEGTWPRPGWPYFEYGTKDRNFHVGDMYLTSRLDGPKNEGKSAVFAVRAMLERAKRASDPAKGVNPAQAVTVFDDAPTVENNYDRNRAFNLNYGQDYWEYEANTNQPPDAPEPRVKEDYIQGYIQMTDSDPDETLNIGRFAVSDGNLCVILDRRNYTRTSQTELDDYAATDPDRTEDQGIILLATFGTNGDEDSASDYLFQDGPNNAVLFNVVNGAVFTSIESLNAVTMFSNVSTSPVAQGKIADFIEVGGTGAIGHSFEPQPDAAINNEFLFYNLLADADGDDKADLTFAEAAFTAIPYLSWCEVVIGDPLMQIAYGPGGKVWRRLDGDANNDGRVNFGDMVLVRMRLGGRLNTTNPVAFERYSDLCDVNKDGIVNFGDLVLTRMNLGATADW